MTVLRAKVLGGWQGVTPRWEIGHAEQKWELILLI